MDPHASGRTRSAKEVRDFEPKKIGRQYRPVARPTIKTVGGCPARIIAVTAPTPTRLQPRDFRSAR